MMKPEDIISKLEENSEVFSILLQDIPEVEYRWKLSEEKWCILEIVCHLRDEEVEDFRTRVRTTLLHPGTTPPQAEPMKWVEERNYLDQDFDDKVASFLREREGSILWLHSLSDPDWSNSWEHPELGSQTALHYLQNWLAHDYLHLRQIIRVKYDYLQLNSGADLGYAGTWV